MAAYRCVWAAHFAAFCLLATSSFATHGEASDKSLNPWELPIVNCDSVTPVCGEGDVKFSSACDAIAAGVKIINDDACLEVKKTAPCNVKCFRADPVCGVDGVTYWCGSADAKCANVAVAHTGFCDLNSGGSDKPGKRASQSLFLVNMLWLMLLGFLIVAGVS